MECLLVRSPWGCWRFIRRLFEFMLFTLCLRISACSERIEGFVTSLNNLELPPSANNWFPNSPTTKTGFSSSPLIFLVKLSSTVAEYWLKLVVFFLYRNSLNVGVYRVFATTSYCPKLFLCFFCCIFYKSIFSKSLVFSFEYIWPTFILVVS